MNKATNDFLIGDVLTEAWKKVKGAKGAYWGGFGLYMLIGFAINLVIALIAFIVYLIVPQAAQDGSSLSLLVNAILNSIGAVTTIFIDIPMLAGLLLIGIRRAVEKKVSALFVFKFFHWYYIKRFLLAWILAVLAVFIPGSLAAICFIPWLSLPFQIPLYIIGGILVLVVIYITLSLSLTWPTIVDQKLSAFQSLKLSYQQVSKHWLKFLGINLLAILILIASAIPLGIGLIWTLPMMNNLFGILYRELIGVKGLDPVTTTEIN